MPFSDKMRKSWKTSRHNPKSPASCASPHQHLPWTSLRCTDQYDWVLAFVILDSVNTGIRQSKISPTASLHPVFSPCKTVTKECFHRGITVSMPVSYMEKNKRLISLSSFSWQVTKKYTEKKRNSFFIINQRKTTVEF